MVSIAVVCESPADQRTGCDLADRVFCEEVDWIEPEMLPHIRQWRGRDTGESCVLWSQVSKQAAVRGYRVSGHFDGQPGELDARATRRALLLFQSGPHLPHTIVLLRDDDRKTQRRRGMQQAIKESTFRGPVVIGLAHPMRECWLLAGFDPQNDQERDRLAELRRELGFDTCENAEQLTAKPESAKRSAKRVLNALTGGDLVREAACWQKTDLHLLASRGHNTGLGEYLDEVRIHMVPLFTRRAPPS